VSTELVEDKVHNDEVMRVGKSDKSKHGLRSSGGM